MFSFIYHTFIYDPLLNGLIFLTNIIPWYDVGIAIIILTILVRIILFPFTHRAIIAQIKMRNLVPQLTKIRDAYKNNKEEQAKKTMELYRQHGVSPFSSFLILFIQLPILIALFQIFQAGFDFNAINLYSFITKPDFLNLNFLGLIDIAKPSIYLSILVGLSQYLQTRLSPLPIPKSEKKAGSFGEELSRSMNTQAKYIMPIFILIISLKLPAAVPLYWTTMNIFAIVHESIVRNKIKKIDKINDRTNPNNKTINRASS